MGRQPLGERAMTGAERVRLWRQRRKKAKREFVAFEDLTEDEKSKVDRAIKQQLRKLQDGFHEAVKNENQQFVAHLHADWKRKVEFAEKYGGGPLSAQQERFPLTRKQFKELLFFTHPDRQDESLRQRAAEIFSAVKAKEDSLVMPEPPTGGPSFPVSPDDLLKSHTKRSRSRKS